MTNKPGENETLPSYLRDHATRIERLERLPRGNGLPFGGEPGQVVGYTPDGEAVWQDVPTPWPEGGSADQVLTWGQMSADLSPPPIVPSWRGPLWWAWVGTQEEYNALGAWDDRVLYVIVQEVPGAITTVTPEDLSHIP